jgi:peptide chain release factor subunit 1
MGMKKEYNIKKELKRLASIKGLGTEMISIYVPPGFSITDEIARLKDEHGQAGNIKSKTTRLNVQGAIDRIIQYLRLYKEPPKNGFAVFAGNTSNVQSNPDIELFSIEPPNSIKANIYRCDSSFLLEPIEAMMEAKEMYVIVVMDGREATVASLKGTQTTIEKKIRSMAHAKMSKGGQSASRYSRIIEESIEVYYKTVADAINAVFEKYQFKPNGLVVGGPGPAKDNFLRAKNLNYRVKVLGTFDIGYTDESGIDELLEKARELLSEQDAVKERGVMETFLNEVSRNGLATYGYEKVKNAMLNDNVTKLILSDDVELTEVHYKCSQCGEEVTAMESGNSRQSRHSCGGSLDIVSQADAVEQLIEMADRKGLYVVFISTNSQYGNELLLGFQGIAAMLKYRR